MLSRRKFVQKSLVNVSAVFMPSLMLISKSEELPKVLILGDSISIGYFPFVQELLADKAIVTRPFQVNGKPENCQGTMNGVLQIDRWIGTKKWDIIHFNFGLHDLKHVNEDSGKNSNDPKDPLQASPKQYKKNLTEIVEKLKATGAKLVFATTTPYPDSGLKPLRDPGMPKKYNKVASRIMKKNDIPVNDLHAFVAPQMEQLQRPSNVHFTEKGSRALAQQVSQVISGMLD